MSVLGISDSVAGAAVSGSFLAGIGIAVGYKQLYELQQKQKVMNGLACIHCWGEFETEDEKIPYDGAFVCPDSAKTLGLSENKS
jgi:hypothetical protein